MAFYAVLGRATAGSMCAEPLHEPGAARLFSGIRPCRGTGGDSIRLLNLPTMQYRAGRRTTSGVARRS